MKKSERFKNDNDEPEQAPRKHRSYIRLPLLALLCLSGLSCQFIDDSNLDANGAKNTTAAFHPEMVTPDAVIDLARRYATHLWTPTAANVKHGRDANGIRVDTPDVGFSESEIRPGWWIPNEENQGIPYQWGGFSTIEAFDQGIRNGLAAGDVYTPSKQGSRKTVSQAAVGIDASGLVSRCWKLPSHYTTVTLPEISVLLASYEDLNPGDILLLPNTHVLIFEKFANPEQTALLAYEAGAPPSWKVMYDFIPVSDLKKLGYHPYRYRLLAGLPIHQETSETALEDPVPSNRAPFVVSPHASFNPWQ